MLLLMFLLLLLEPRLLCGGVLESDSVAEVNQSGTANAPQSAKPNREPKSEVKSPISVPLPLP